MKYHPDNCEYINWADPKEFDRAMEILKKFEEDN